jgi:hypothetical protein
VLVTRDMQGDRLERALLFTLQRMSVCPGPEFGREKPLNGLCIARREVSNPRFDALIEVWGPYDDRDLTLFSGQGGPKARRGDVVIYDCRVLCQIILLVHPAQAKRLAFPVYPVFAFGLDSGGPFGLRYSERPLIVRPPQEVLRAAFGFDVTAGDPRPGFDKDVPHGSPLLPWAKYFRDLEDKRREEADAAYREKLRAMDRPLEIYREKLRTLREQHADCSSPIISNGPEPKYLGCSKQPASNLPTFSQLQQRLGGH